jgi:redox-sensitive bicupin YhaK (pirin superfamily)
MNQTKTSPNTVRKSATRSVSSVIDSIRTVEGEGFVVHRPFPTDSLSYFDPFLLLDEMGPMDLAPGEAKGAPDHPHRGFETVTYLLEGRFEHKDSHGNSGRLNPGDVQWMTAGSGVVHSEMPEKSFVQAGGRLHGFQLWVNLPRRNKMTKPRYQDISASKIPVVHAGGGRVTAKVIAGEAWGARAVIDTHTPIIYLHLTLQPGAKLAQAVPRDYNAFAYVIDGKGVFGDNGHHARGQQIVLFAKDGDEVSFTADRDAKLPLEVLLIAGIPLEEPVARYGPFVMNTQQEIYDAIEDYRNSKMGSIHP